MRTPEELKIERWDDSDFIITGMGINHTGIYSKRDTQMIVNFLKNILPLIQEEAFNAGVEKGMRDAAEKLKGKWDAASKLILSAIKKSK